MHRNEHLRRHGFAARGRRHGREPLQDLAGLVALKMRYFLGSAGMTGLTAPPSPSGTTTASAASTPGP